MTTGSYMLMELNHHGHQSNLLLHSLLQAEQHLQVVKKQFPLRPAAAKTIHRSQGDTETKLVVNFETRRAIPHIHYVGLSRVTTIDGLYVTDLCENKIAVSDDIQTEMHRLRTEGQLSLSVKPIYCAPQNTVKICYLNTRSLHKHIKDICTDTGV